MKRFIRISAAAVAGLALAGSAAATLDAQSHDTVTRVPFEFTVGAAELPRDTYRVAPLPGHNDAFLINGPRGSAVVLSQPDGKANDTSPRLVFHRYGDRYFLREVRMAGNTGFSLPQTKSERDAEERIAGLATREIVVVRAEE